MLSQIKAYTQYALGAYRPLFEMAPTLSLLTDALGVAVCVYAIISFGGWVQIAGAVALAFIVLYRLLWVYRRVDT